MPQNKIFEIINGELVSRELTAEEIAEAEAYIVKMEKDYWQNVDYDDAVNTEIRKRYTVSQELAVLRQKDDKPEEYAEYYAYCEECKALVKEKKTM